MIEMLKSKTVIAFIIIFLGIVLISTPSTKLENSQEFNEEYISSNLK